MMRATVVAVVLVELHGPSGQRLMLNPAEVSSLREPIDVSSHHWAKGTRCIAVMGNGGVIALAEDCTTAKAKLTEGVKP